ncbi:MAG: hypothetical protein E7466_07315 [Ruminococcaceae bacterium]|nr:hypothetical protein [Oscillospiraceae bacterium]MBQ3215726.1 hypothetical protein [Oscillospiraceae bacterium]
MRLANLSDPATQAELREEAWDEKCEAFPHCHQCGGSLYPYDTYTELDDKLYCENCVSNGTHCTDSLEVF